MHEDQLEPKSGRENGERKNEITEKNQFRKPAGKYIKNVNKTTARKHHGKEEEMLNQDLNRHSSAKRKRKRYERKKRAESFSFSSSLSYSV